MKSYHTCYYISNVITMLLHSNLQIAFEHMNISHLNFKDYNFWSRLKVKLVSSKAHPKLEGRLFSESKFTFLTYFWPLFMIRPLPPIDAVKEIS